MFNNIISDRIQDYFAEIEEGQRVIGWHLLPGWRGWSRLRDDTCSGAQGVHCCVPSAGVDFEVKLREEATPIHIADVAHVMTATLQSPIPSDDDSVSQTSSDTPDVQHPVCHDRRAGALNVI